jgi:hypothetical protein
MRGRAADARGRRTPDRGEPAGEPDALRDLARRRWLHSHGDEVRTTVTLPSRMLVLERAHAVLPTDPDDSAARALVLVALGERVWENALAFTRGRPQHRERRDRELPSQAQAVLRLLGEGLTDEVVARKLGVSVRTGRHGVTPACRCGARGVLVNAYGFGGTTRRWCWRRSTVRRPWGPMGDIAVTGVGVVPAWGDEPGRGGPPRAAVGRWGVVRPPGAARGAAVRVLSRHSPVRARPQRGRGHWRGRCRARRPAGAAARQQRRSRFDDEDLPANTYYGDGGRISDETVAHLRAAYRSATTRRDACCFT